MVVAVDGGGGGGRGVGGVCSVYQFDKNHGLLPLLLIYCSICLSFVY